MSRPIIIPVKTTLSIQFLTVVLVRPTPESMNEQITAIAALLLEINGKEKYTAFFDFSGHVRTFSIRIYSGKWSQGKDPLFNLSLQNKDGQQWRNWDNAHAMSGDSILSFLTTLL